MKPKTSTTGGRLMNLLAANGYVMADTSGLTDGLLWLSKLTKDRVTANQFLTWKAVSKTREPVYALSTDLCDLNEKLVEHGFPPLKYEVRSESTLQNGIELVKRFGKKIVGKL